MTQLAGKTTTFATNGNGHGPGMRPGNARIVELVGSGKLVLFVGRPDETLLRALRDAVCDVVLVSRDSPPGAVERVAEFCGRVIGRPMPTDRLLAEIGDVRFDAVVLDGPAATAAGLAALVTVLDAMVIPHGLVIGRLPALSAAGTIGPVLERAGLTLVDVEQIGPDSDARQAAIFAACRFSREQRSLVAGRLRRLEGLEREAAALRGSVAETAAERNDARATAADLRRRLDESQAEQKHRGDEIERMRRMLKDERSQARSRVHELETELRSAVVDARRTAALVADLRRAGDAAAQSATRVAALQEQVRTAEAAVHELESQLADTQEMLEASGAEAESQRRRAERLEGRDRELRQLILDAHEQLLERDEELAAALADRNDDAYLRYRAVIARVRELVDGTVPADATVAVVSKGDDELLQLGGRTAWHVPRTEDGVYRGHHPADGAEAVAHLEALRALGAQFFVLPGTSWWWLDHYPELAAHLERHHRTLVREENLCLIVDLHSAEALAEDARGAAYAELVAGVRDLVERSVPEGATLVVATRGDAQLLDLGNRTAWHLPQAEAGVYAGYHPASSVAAIAQLEAAREQGARFLVLPETQRWWLEHYDELAQHLERHARLVARTEGVGAVYLLRRPRRWLWFVRRFQ
jgi:hypothetical protein